MLQISQSSVNGGCSSIPPNYISSQFVFSLMKITALFLKKKKKRKKKVCDTNFIPTTVQALIDTNPR